jgi:hypothetical protein
MVCCPRVKRVDGQGRGPVWPSVACPILVLPSSNEITPDVTGLPATVAIAFSEMLSPSTPVAEMLKVTYGGRRSRLWLGRKPFPNPG